MSPGKLRTYKSLGLQGLHCLDDMQVWNCGQLRMFWCIEILFGNHNTLLEEVFVDSIAMRLWHEHAEKEKKVKTH